MNTRSLVLTLLLSILACEKPAASPPPGAALAPPPPPTPQALDASAASAPQPAPSEEDAAVPISPRNPTWGSRLAPVTIVEFAELQCPYSSKARATLAALREKYGPDKLRIVWKNDPLAFHKNSRPAAEAAMGVFATSGGEAFWRFHDLAFDNQDSLGRDAYLRWAQQAGVRDLVAYAAGLDSNQWAFGVEQDMHEVTTLGVQGTPAFFINGVLVSGAQPLATFTKAVDEQLAKAQAELAAGSPPERLYARLAASGRAGAEKKAADDKSAEEERERVVHRVPLGKRPELGPYTAHVTIVEFADFQCPFSARVQETLRSLRAKHWDKMRIIWGNQPLPSHKAAEAAAEAALEVRAEKGDAAFWSMHDKLFASQKALLLGDGPNTDFIADLAVEAGANRDRVKAAIAKETHKSEIEADEDLADDFEASGTPTFFINGRRVAGAQPLEKFEKVVEEEIGRAQALLDSGAKYVDLYATLTKDGVGAADPEKRDVPAGLPKSDPILGSATAKVSMHEWADFQCPFCSRVEPTVQKLVKDYAGRLKVVWHDLPLLAHPDARGAAQAAREAYAQKGNPAFWAMHDKLFASPEHLKRADLDGYASALGLDGARWAAALDAESHASEIDADATAASEVKITSTPNFLVVGGSAGRGYFISGAQSYRKFRRLVERALAETK